MDVHLWIEHPAGPRREAVHRLLVGAGVRLLGRPAEDVAVWRDPAGRPWVGVGAAEGTGGRDAAGPVAGPYVSVSHGRGVVAVAACATRPVGVDVEARRPLPVLALARRWFDPAEAEWLAGRPAELRVEAFLRLWTAKEAVGKAFGRGLREGGLRRVVARPVQWSADGPDDGPAGAVVFRPLPGDGTVMVGHPQVGADDVVAIALLGGVPSATLIVDHDRAAARSTEGSRTSLPVVVRGS